MKSSTQNVALYQLSYNQVKTYLLAVLFIVGNIALPQLCHLMPQGGLIFLPIYFFTLVAAYKYGLVVGLTTAVLSPLVNSALFGMPPAVALPIILIKSVTLAIAAALIAKKTNKVTLLTVALAVIAYQLIGSLAELAITGSFEKASQDIILGWPGCLIQIVGGFVILRYLLKK
jgi:hypothetical protein